MNCLVTGCAGFIGYHLTKRLLKEGHNVIGFDNMSNGRQEYVNELSKNPNFLFVKEDVYNINKYGYSRANDMPKVNVVFHLAANSEICNPDPDKEIKDTFCTTFEILKYCRDNDIKKFVFTSSGAVYGEAYKRGITYVGEDDGPILPISYYGAAKAASEAFISSFSTYYDITSFICRLPNVIGDHATHGVILDFVMKIKKNPKVLEVLGDGSQTKPYMLVSDVVDAMLYILANPKSKVNYYNIAGMGTTSVKTIAQLVVSAMGTHTEIIYTGGDRGWTGDSPRYYPSKEKLKGHGYFCPIASDMAVLTAIKQIIKENE